MTFDPDAMIDAYLDGQLSAADRERLEQTLRQRPELRAEIQRQRHIDDALKRLFDPPPASSFLERLGLETRNKKLETRKEKLETGNQKAEVSKEYAGPSGGAGRKAQAADEGTLASEPPVAPELETRDKKLETRKEHSEPGGRAGRGAQAADERTLADEPAVAPEPPVAPGRAAAHRPPIRLRSWLRRPPAVAAVLVLGAVGVWRVWSFGRLNVADLLGAIDPGTLTYVYQAQVETKHMQPVWVCKDDQEIADTLRRELGQPLALGRLPAGVQTLGWSYGHTLSPHTLYLLARVDDRPVIVCIDRADRADPSYDKNAPWWSGLRVFKRQVGELLAYEITPLRRASVLPLLHEPQPGAADGGDAPPP